MQLTHRKHSRRNGQSGKGKPKQTDHAVNEAAFLPSGAASVEKENHEPAHTPSKSRTAQQHDGAQLTLPEDGSAALTAPADTVPFLTTDNSWSSGLQQAPQDRSPAAHDAHAEVDVSDMHTPSPRPVGRDFSHVLPGLSDSEDEEGGSVTPDSRPLYDIPVDVPYEEGTRRVKNITTRTDFCTFNKLIATRMEIPVIKCVGLGWIASWQPKNPRPKPKSLEDEDDYSCMIDDVIRYCKESLKKTKNKEVKPFTITVVPMRDMTKAASSGKDRKGAKKKKTYDEDDHSDDSTDDTSACDAGTKILRQIEKLHACDSCGDGAVCAVLDGGQHYQLSNRDKSSWAALCKKHRATLQEVPIDALGITSASVAMQQAAKKKAAEQIPLAAPSAPATFAAPPPSNPYEAVMASMLGNLLANSFATTVSPTPSSVIPQKRLADEDLAVVEVQNVPLHDWLKKLEEDPVRSRANIKYSDFEDTLRDHDFRELSDIYGLTPERLSAAAEITFGLAKRLIDYANEDCGNVMGQKRVRWV
ncbi:hypothetical protein EV121DRAFT_274349 [Schizophyllum commune]